MKNRLICFLLSFALLLSLASCAAAELSPITLEAEKVTETEQKKGADPSSEEEKKQNPAEDIREIPTGTFDPTGFAVGFGRYKITPPRGTPMGGYGNESTRLSSRTDDDLYATCVAVSDGEKVAIFFSVDLLGVNSYITNHVCTALQEEFGISEEYVFITATHSHSAGSSSETAGGSIAAARMVKAARDAMATLDSAEMHVGTTRTEKMAYVRRYLKADGSYIYRDKLPSNASEPEYRHETDADNEMQIIRFVRKNQKDVLMVNWTCHVTTVGGMRNTNISSDWVGAFRDEVEEEADVYFAFMQGAAGNVTPGTRLVGEKEQNNAEDYIKHGKDVAAFCLAALPSLQKIETGKVRAVPVSVLGYRDTDVGEFNLEAAQRIADLFANGKTNGEVDELCRENGFASHYHARAILARSKVKPEEVEVELKLAAIAIGDVGFAGVPFELFDTSGMQVKDGSPFEITFMCGYTNNSYGYLPNIEAFPNHQYEVDTTRFVPGTAENLVAALLKALKGMA